MPPKGLNGKVIVIRPADISLKISDVAEKIARALYRGGISFFHALERKRTHAAVRFRKTQNLPTVDSENKE